MYGLVQANNFILRHFLFCCAGVWLILIKWNLPLEVFIYDFQVAKLQNLYKSWEENPDIGFVVMKVKFVYPLMFDSSYERLAWVYGLFKIQLPMWTTEKK